MIFQAVPCFFESRDLIELIHQSELALIAIEALVHHWLLIVRVLTQPWRLIHDFYT